MKIAFLSTFYPYRGGIAQFNAALYRELEKSHEVRAYTFRRQYPDFLFPGKTQYVTEFDKADPIPSIRILDTINPFSYWKTAQAINEYAPDLLIMRFWTPFLAPALGTVTRWLNEKIKVVTIVDNMIPHERKFTDKPFAQYFLRHNTHFIVMSQAVKNDLLSLTSNPKRVLHIQHPSYDHFGMQIDQLEARKNLGLLHNKNTILFFGIIREYKGLDLLIKAFELLDNTFQLVIAGECYGSFNKYQTIINDSNRKCDIHVHNGYIADEEVSNYFCAADVCVLPYRSATQSGIIAIANHFELPVIATNVGGLKESVQHLKTGLIVPKVNPVDIAASIRQYFDDGLKDSFVHEISDYKSECTWMRFSEKMIHFAMEEGCPS